MRTAVIEIGATAIRAVVAEPAAGGWFTVHAERHIVLGLERAIRYHGEIGHGLRLLVTETVRRLVAECSRAGAGHEVTVLGATVASAADRSELLALLGTDRNGPVRVRTMIDEARLALLAAHPLVGNDETVTMAEMREHGTRLIRRDRGCIRAQDLPGIHTLAGTTDEPGMVAEASRDRATVSQAGAGAAGQTPLVTGPIGLAIGRALLHRRFGRHAPPPDRLLVTGEELAALENHLLRTTATQRQRLPAAAPEAVDVLTGVARLRVLVDRWGVGAVRLCQAGVTEGQILDALALDPPAPGDGAVAAERACSDHARTTAALAESLVDALAPSYGWSTIDRDLVRDASLLHDLAGGHERGGAHRTGAVELLRDGVHGREPEQVVELASLVRFHRGRPPGPHFAPFGRLSAARRGLVTELTGILRLACALDRGRDSAVAAVTADVDPMLICIHAFGDRPLDLAMHAVHGDQHVLATALGRRVVVHDAGGLPARHRASAAPPAAANV